MTHHEIIFYLFCSNWSLNLSDEIDNNEMRVEIGLDDFCTFTHQKQMDNMGICIEVRVDEFQVVLTTDGVDCDS
jgi:hypothetical protein